jgi:uncharacterized protein YeeX (DUF496 family)
MEMFKHVKEDLIQRENEKNERKQRENKEVYELREQLLPFIKKADEIIEEYTKI